MILFLLYHVIFKAFHTPSSIAVEAGIAGFHVNSCAICGYFDLFVSYFSRFHTQGSVTTCEITNTNPVSFVIHITFFEEIGNEMDAVSGSLIFLKNSRQTCFMGYPKTSNFVKSTPLRAAFSTLFLVFGYPDEALSLVFDILRSQNFLLALILNIKFNQNVRVGKTAGPGCSKTG